MLTNSLGHLDIMCMRYAEVLVKGLAVFKAKRFHKYKITNNSEPFLILLQIFQRPPLGWFSRHCNAAKLFHLCTLHVLFHVMCFLYNLWGCWDWNIDVIHYSISKCIDALVQVCLWRILLDKLELRLPCFGIFINSTCKSKQCQLLLKHKVNHFCKILAVRFKCSFTNSLCYKNFT